MSIDTAATTGTFTESVADVARAAGVATSAVRFYEKHGLVSARRTAGDARRFEADAACRIKVAKVAQRVGLTVREIADILAVLPRDARPQDWDFVCRTLIDEAEERIAGLRATLDALGGGAKAGCARSDILAPTVDFNQGSTLSVTSCQSHPCSPLPDNPSASGPHGPARPSRPVLEAHSRTWVCPNRSGGCCISSRSTQTGWIARR
ncbi:MerR family DNA-binding transcriptional regulator [Rhodococcus sp. H29-C3]|uniref:MerR family DNA-binding transcriptional regulator n=1 Tax=Rhodococcus sp. H29-C3 TaxID=3046307 RepID=UPI0024BA8651|nr:MerR family DNA-binding transcriptional regulator [Rhodococcus sp. H29-C3]MDJ0362994.1 MerR family DNA-binding transcriptional regulator [Rhodococcus sp. H29-C3]